MASKDASKDVIKDTLRGHFECAGSQGCRRRRLRNGKYEEPPRCAGLIFSFFTSIVSNQVASRKKTRITKLPNNLSSKISSSGDKSGTRSRRLDEHPSLRYLPNRRVHYPFLPNF